MRLDVFDEPLLVFAHPEEIVGFDDRVDRAAAFGAVAVDQILFGEEPFAADAVPALVFGLVDFVAVEELLQDLLDDGLVARLGGADKVVVGDFQALPQLLEADDGLVALLLRGDPVGSAACCTFWPCSSVPVRKWVGTSSRRW